MMKKSISIMILSLLLGNANVWANELSDQQAELEASLTLRFKYESLANMRESYEKELHVLETQYQRNKQIEDFQKKQRPDSIKTPVYTRPYAFISSEEWQQSTLEYVNNIKTTEIPRRNATEVVFHFPNVSSKIKNNFPEYRIDPPKITVVSVLLSSGKLIKFDKIISSRPDEQSITVETEGSTILKINLIMNYQIPNENSSKIILSKDKPNSNGIVLIPSFDNVVTLQLSANKANSVMHIDAVDVRGNTLASQSAQKTNNINDLSTMSMRIEILQEFIEAVDKKEVKNKEEAIKFIVDHSGAYLQSYNNPIRELSKSFTGKIEQAIIYTIDNPKNLEYSFSLYP